MLSARDQFFLDQPEPNQSCLLALQDLLLSINPDLKKAWKWKLPFFCYKGKNIAYFWVDKKTKKPYIGIVDGYKIDHPLLEAGDRTQIRIIRIEPNEKPPTKAIQKIITQALSFYQT